MAAAFVTTVSEVSQMDLRLTLQCLSCGVPAKARVQLANSSNGHLATVVVFLPLGWRPRVAHLPSLTFECPACDAKRFAEREEVEPCLEKT